MKMTFWFQLITYYSALTVMINNAVAFESLSMEDMKSGHSLVSDLEHLRSSSKSTSVSKSRRKRASLYWPPGSRFVADFDITIFIPAPSGVSIPFTVNVPYRFQLPNITTSLLGRSFDERSDIYGTIENFLSWVGIDGHACVLRAVCERAEVHLLTESLVGDLLTMVLAASASVGSSNVMEEYIQAEMYGRSNGDCGSAYSSCPISLFTWLQE